MKVFQNKHSRWVYAVLGVMLVAFLLIGSLPGLMSNRSQAKSTTSPVNTTLPADQQAQLETQAQGYELVLEREPNNEVALKGLLNTRLQLGDLERAIEPLVILAKLNPQQTDYQLLLAQAQQELNDLVAAEGTYRQVLKLAPQNEVALQGITNVLVRQERSDEAIALLQSSRDRLASTQSSAQATTPTDTTIVPETQSAETNQILVTIDLLIGQVWARQQNYEQAIAAYAQAEEIDPDDFRPLLAKAMVRQAQGELKEARALLDAAASLAPEQYSQDIKALALAALEAQIRQQQAEQEAKEQAKQQAEQEASTTVPDSPEAAETQTSRGDQPVDEATSAVKAVLPTENPSSATVAGESNTASGTALEFPHDTSVDIPEQVTTNTLEQPTDTAEATETTAKNIENPSAATVSKDQSTPVRP